jgi:hypothetical protein
MAPADAEHCFAFIAFDCPVYTLEVYVAYLGADVHCVDNWLLAGCEPVSHHLIIPVRLCPLSLYSAIYWIVAD